MATSSQITAMSAKASTLKLPSQKELERFKSFKNFKPSNERKPKLEKPKTKREIYLANLKKLEEI